MQIEEFLLSQFRQYPKMQIQDVLKGIHQSCFGCGHFVDREKGFAYLEKELKYMKNVDINTASDCTGYIEPLAGGFCRVQLGILNKLPLLPETLFNIFVLSSEWERPDDSYRLIEDMIDCFVQLCEAGSLPFEPLEVKKKVEEWKGEGFAACHHSDIFRREYFPAYRLVREEYCELIELLAKIDELTKQKDRVLVAIEGRCASGKTTLANILKGIYKCNVFHADDFFLQKFQRTHERLAEVGGNLDRERLLEEVLEPILNDMEVAYRPYNCKAQRLEEAIIYKPMQINIIEGSYSMHPLLANKYDLSIFVDVDYEIQKKRILKRNGPELLKRFVAEWIVMEEAYFKEMDIAKRCDIKISFKEMWGKIK